MIDDQRAMISELVEGWKIEGDGWRVRKGNRYVSGSAPRPQDGITALNHSPFPWSMCIESEARWGECHTGNKRDGIAREWSLEERVQDWQNCSRTGVVGGHEEHQHRC